MKYLLSFDIGTSGLKTSLLNENFELVDSATYAYETHYGKEGEVESDPNDWWKAAVESCGKIKDAHPDEIDKVVAIGLDGMMTGTVPVDKDGNALMRSLIHADGRAKAQEQRLREQFGASYFYNISANVLSAFNSLNKILWIKDEAPEIYEKTAVFLQSKDYLVYRLTGNMRSTDLSDASHGGLISIERQQYDDEMLKNVGIARDKLPDLHTSCEIVGNLTEEAASQLGLKSGIPVSAGGGDAICAIVGAGIARPGKCFLILGTTAGLAVMTKKPYFDHKHRVFSINSIDGQNSLTFGTTECAGSCVKWIQRMFNTPKPREVDIMGAKVPRGSEGLIFLPYIEGERSPIFDSSARGMFFGLTPFHTKEHMNRAVLEGVACGLSENVDILREIHPIDEIRIVGGGTASVFWQQIIADMLNVRLVGLAGSGDSSCSIGASAAAAVAIGMIPDLATVADRLPTGNVIEPNPEAVEEYKLLQKKYRMLYPAVKDIMHMTQA